MIMQELNLNFKNSQQVTINFAQHPSVIIDFSIPLTAQDREAIRHYLEVYAAQYVMDIDDQAADKISNKLLPQFGQKLFAAVFNNDSAKQLFTQFINTPSDKYLLTITAQSPDILSLPWELLHDSGNFLFASEPSITILRRIPPKKTFPNYASQSRLHILFIVSRPQDANFIDPRTDAKAVLKAIAGYTDITVEFLQPATLENLWQRLQNSDLPQVDVIHFDGHGIFDKSGDLVKTVIAQLSGISRDLRKQLRNLEIGTNTGYLLFEGYDKHELYVPTSWLNYILSESKIRFIVLSACQSAMVVHENKEIEEEAIGSIAVGLTANSIPNVLAMSYSVMVKATELLFGEFYREIAAGNSIGIALDKARQVLLLDRKRRDLQRGQEQVEIKVSDWFLPTLYQASEDIPLVLKMETKLPKDSLHNLLTLPNAGFWGRNKELWQIENWFVDGVRRVVVSGFSGQGKTFLVQELGRWLLQKGMFDVVAFVDYSGYQGLDAVQWAVTTLGSVVGQSLVDVDAANVVLQSRRVLLVLDNLEVYVKDKQETLQELLTVANQWSLLGETRVLVTTRPVDLGHEVYQDGVEDFRQLKLEGLSEEDALHYFERLLELSDNPVTLQTDKLLRWFAKVQFHPLSIGLLARALEAGDLGNLEARLNQLVLESDNDPVKATLQLVIEQLDEESQGLLPRLGVFQGGALEDILLKITKIPAEKWDKLRLSLILTGLIQTETFSKIRNIYLQFHPRLTSILQLGLQPNNQDNLYNRYKHCYYELSGELLSIEITSPSIIHAIIKHELPNLLFVVKKVLVEETDYAVEFADQVNKFLYIFGLQHDLKQLNKETYKLAEKMGEKNWFLNQTSVGEQFFNMGNYSKAADIFNEVLTNLGNIASYNRCLTLNHISRCFNEQKKYKQAIFHYKMAFDTIQKLEQNKDVQRQTGILYTDLACTLRDMGRYKKAKSAYEKSLVIKKQIGGDERGEAIVQGELGTLALYQGNLVEAEQRYKSALIFFQRFHEPHSEAIGWHKLGEVYMKDNQLEAAEHAYRQAANIEESIGNLVSAAKTWNNLALVLALNGKLTDAEAWYHKAIDVHKQHGNIKNEAIGLYLLQHVHKISNFPWKTINNFAGIWYQFKQKHSKLILAVARCGNVNATLKHYSIENWTLATAIEDITTNYIVALLHYNKRWENLTTAIQQIVTGKRDKEKLCKSLNFEEALIITAVLDGIENPESLKWFEED